MTVSPLGHENPSNWRGFSRFRAKVPPSAAVFSLQFQGPVRGGTKRARRVSSRLNVKAAGEWSALWTCPSVLMSSWAPPALGTCLSPCLTAEVAEPSARRRPSCCHHFVQQPQKAKRPLVQKDRNPHREEQGKSKKGSKKRTGDRDAKGNRHGGRKNIPDNPNRIKSPKTPKGTKPNQTRS